MGFLRTSVLLALVALAGISATPQAAADPTVCGPWNGNQAIKSRTCVDPERAPECPVYTEYFTGLHYGVICYGVPVVGDPGDPGSFVPEGPRCATPSTYGAQAWVCVDPGDEDCTVSRQHYLLGEYSDEECMADPTEAIDIGSPHLP